MFNFFLQLAKPRGKSGSHGTRHVFTCKASYSLHGKKVAEFSNERKCFILLTFQQISPRLSELSSTLWSDNK